MSVSPVVATTSSGHRSVGEILLLLLTAASAAAVAVGLVGFVADSDPVSSTLFVVLGSLFVLAGLVALPRLRLAEHHELRVGAAGLTVVNHREERHWAWEELSGLAVSGGAVRRLVLEDERADQVRSKAPGLDAVNRAAGMGSPVSVRVPLSGMQPDESVILEAIRSCSGGRFPDHELRPGRQSPPRT